MNRLTLAYICGIMVFEMGVNRKMTVTPDDIKAARKRWDAQTRGAAFKKKRLEYGINISELARKADVTRQTIYNFESGIEPYASTEAALLDAVTTLRAEKIAPRPQPAGISANEVYGESTFTGIADLGKPQSGKKAKPSQGPFYQEAIKILLQLGRDREGMKFLDVLERTQADVSRLLKLANATKNVYEAKAIADLATGLFQELTEGLQFAKEHPDGIENEAEPKPDTVTV